MLLVCFLWYFGYLFGGFGVCCVGIGVDFGIVDVY